MAENPIYFIRDIRKVIEKFVPDKDQARQVTNLILQTMMIHNVFEALHAYSEAFRQPEVKESNENR